MELYCKKQDKLTVKIYSDRKDLGENAGKRVAEIINSIIKEKGEATVVFAAAPSQNEMLAQLCRENVDWTKVRAMHQDEYLELDPLHPAGFGNFMRRAIFEQKPFKEIYYLMGISDDPEVTKATYSKLLEKFPPDLILLGIGENGHLAFNDPAVADFNDPERVKVVNLDDVCRMQQVNDGCFATFDDVPKRAFTLTMSQVINIPNKLACVPGKLKAEAINNLLYGNISTSCPASILRECENAELYLDADSASIAISKYK
ncbi:MAG: 6-phosphogluconolactonase [Oscillospiraceae bacterium]